MRRAIVMVGCVVFLLLVAGGLLYRRGSDEVPTSLRAPAVAERSDRTPVLEAPPAPVVVEEAPIVEAAATAAPEPVLVEPKVGDASTGSLVVRVVEEGTRVPLERVTLSLWLEDADPPVRHSGVTDAEGRKLFEELDPGEYGMNLRWTFLPGVEPFNVGATVKTGETTSKEVEFPGRESFLFRLIDSEGNPIAGHALKVGFTTTRPFDSDTAVYEEVVTGADGTFFGLGYRSQMGWSIRSDEPLLMKKANFPTRREERGLVGMGNWENPISFQRDSSGRDDFVQDVVGLRDLVMAECTVVGARDLGPNARYVAYVMGRDRRVREIPIEDNGFEFIAPVSSRLAVSVCTLPDHSGDPPPMATHGGLKPFGGTLELLEEITLPDEPGEFAFEMRYPEPVMVTGRVLDPEGNGVGGVEVIAASAMDREPFDFIPSFAQPDIETIARRSQASNSRGEFAIEVPPDMALDFFPDLMTVPEDMRTHRELRRSAQELLEEPELTLYLQFSSLIWGELVDTDGGPVGGQRVELFSLDNERVPLASAVADVEGIFELNAPVSGTLGGGDEPVISQEHYIRAGEPHRAPVGYAAIAFNSTEPVTVVMRDFTTIMLEAPEGGRLPLMFEFSSTITIPGLERRAESHRGRMPMRAQNRLFPLPRGYSRVELLNLESISVDPNDPDNAIIDDPFVIDIPEDAEDVMTVVWE